MFIWFFFIIDSGRQKQKQYDWKDTNLSLFGSDTERNVKSKLYHLSLLKITANHNRSTALEMSVINHWGSGGGGGAGGGRGGGEGELW